MLPIAEGLNMGASANWELSMHDGLRFRALSAMAPIAMLETAIDGGLIWANERWFEFVGAHPNDTLGRLWLEVVHPDERARVIDGWRAAASELAPFTIECRLCVPNQNNRWIEVHGAPLFDPAQGTTYVLTAMDVTHRRNLNDLARTTRDLETWAEQSAATLAQQSNELGIFAALIASSTDAIAIVDPHETVRYANGAFRKLFDVETDISWPELLMEIGVDENAGRALHSISVSGEMWQSTVTLQRPRLGTLHAEVSSYSIMDATSRKIGLAIVVRDLSAHKEVEVERARMHAEIIAAQEAAIRELSTPLLPIWPGIVAMPLVGNIDATRGQQILDTLLDGIHNHHASVAILDVTGVRQINADVADILLRSAQAAGLLGTSVLLTGVSSFVAKTIIQLGTDLSRVRTLATLEQGIRAAFADARNHKEHKRRNIHLFASK